MAPNSDADDTQAGVVEAGEPPSETSPPDTADTAERLTLYRYVTAENAAEYLQLMRLFTETLLNDLSAAEAHEALLRTVPGTALSVDDIEHRCRQLVTWGNLVPSVRDARVATVSEWLRSRSRYQASKLGGRVHRQVDNVLRASDGAREIARELLGGTVQTLERILAHLDATPVDGDALAGDVTTVFNNQRLFAESATDFYAFVQGRISRYDLGGPEYAAFKTMLLTYVDLISADVARHAPAVAALLEQIEDRLDLVLATLDSLPGLTGTDEQTERSPGRTRADWEELTAWYTGRRGRSGPTQLRAAADQALGQLIAPSGCSPPPAPVSPGARTCCDSPSGSTKLTRRPRTASSTRRSGRTRHATFSAAPTRTPGEPAPQRRGGTATLSTCRCRYESAATAPPEAERPEFPTQGWTASGSSPRRRPKLTISAQQQRSSLPQAT